jgi:outer membrane protein OmpA-like peptidoglycan-associated protein
MTPNLYTVLAALVLATFCRVWAGDIVDVSSRPVQQAGIYAGEPPPQWPSQPSSQSPSQSKGDQATEDLDQRTLIHFDEGNAKLEPHADAKLKRVASELKKDPHLQVTIEGHSDSKEAPSASQKIAEARADSVKSALIKQGVAPSQIETYGFGSSKPVASNSTVDGRAENRRVELYLEDMESAS